MKDFLPQIRRLAVLWLLAFAVLAVAAGYWQVVAAPALQAHPWNTRAAERLNLTQPGDILSADNALVLGAERSEGLWKRTYPEPEVFCHLTGYNEQTGLQAGVREALYGLGRFADPWQTLTTGRMRGLDVHLTLDANAQREATAALRGLNGAVVAIDPRSGAIRALVSSPSYSPEIIRYPEEYDVFRTDPNSPELNRALKGLYTPGSALKVLTVAAALETGAVKATDTFVCHGQDEVAGTRVTCHQRSGHGKITVADAVAQSCNVAFAQIGLKIGAQRYRDYVKRFHLLDPAEAGGVPLESATGRLGDVLGPKGKIMLAHTAYGQGATWVTPLAMARLLATIGAGGTVRQPFLVERIVSGSGRTVYTGQARELGEAVSATTSRAVAGMMVRAVEKGTAGIMRLRGVDVAAKTGTGEKGGGEKPDVWILALAPAEDPVVALAVVVEKGDSGAETAGPIAVRVLRALLGG